MKYKVGIIGAAGYTAGELIRILVNHPEVELNCAQSASQAGSGVAAFHHLIGETDLDFTQEVDESCDVYFLCKGHGESKGIIEEYGWLLEKKVIDLSQDFRLKGDHDFAYGLPELNRELISSSSLIANPGCFASSIQLGLLPALNSALVKGDIHVSGITGSTGAGQKLSATTHFSWRQANASVYKALNHQHLLEIGETVSGLADDFPWEIRFIPYRGAFTRGIITTSYFQADLGSDELREVYQNYYEDQLFTHVVNFNPDLKQVVNTNKALVFPQIIGSQAVVVTVIDNLLKGASGQAIQNMNLILGLPEDTGLRLKASTF